MVDDRSAKVPGGQQCITTLDGYVLPLQIRAGLVYLDMHPPSDQELASLPYVVLTSDVDWDPSTLDHELDLDTWSSQSPHTKDPYAEHRFEKYGDYLHRHVNEASMHPVLDYSLAGTCSVFLHEVGPGTPPDIEALQPCFAWAPVDVIKHTFAVTTRYAKNILHLPLRKHFKSRFPALNVHRRR